MSGVQLLYSCPSLLSPSLPLPSPPPLLPLPVAAVVERASVTVGEPTSYDTTVGTFGELGRALTDDISKVFQQTGIPPGEKSRSWLLCF